MSEDENEPTDPSEQLTLSEYAVSLAKYIASGLPYLAILIPMAAIALVIVFVIFKSFLSAMTSWESGIRWIGIFMQWAGFGIVASALEDRGSLFGIPRLPHSLWRSFCDYLSRFPRRTARKVAIRPTALEVSPIMGKAYAFVRHGEGASLEDRIKSAEDSIEMLHAQIGDLRKESSARSAEIENSLTNIRKELRSERERLREAMVGGLNLERLGVLLFFFGVLLGTASPELATVVENVTGNRP